MINKRPFFELRLLNKLVFSRSLISIENSVVSQSVAAKLGVSSFLTSLYWDQNKVPFLIVDRLWNEAIL